jgi:ABC-type antimicrobial peptide transport system permease subunit
MFDVDPSLALSDLRGMEQRVTDSLTIPHTVSRLTLVFAGCALLLAAIGVYGTLAQAVVARTRELGVRRALGALDMDVFRLVMRQGAAPVVAGVVAGIPLAWLLGRQLQAVLYEVAPTDVTAWVFAFVAMILVAAAAAALPGWRATRIEPMEALRHE